MDWDSLNGLIPMKVEGTELYSSNTLIADGDGWKIYTLHPGKHKDSKGDFRIDVFSVTADWDNHPFRHNDLFADIGNKSEANRTWMTETFAPALAKTVVNGIDPRSLINKSFEEIELPGLEIEALLIASQALALCEHRRYEKYEPETGRFLPARLAVGIIYYVWPYTEAIRVQREGRRGLTHLRGKYGHEVALEELVKD